MNASEEYVLKLCQRTFLSLWSYSTPRGKDSNKELCDCLVVCDPDIIIFSVKEIGLKAAGDPLTNWQRWQKRAVEESVDQLYGAARFIGNSPNVVTDKGESGLVFPDLSRRRIHLVAVALGGNREGPISYGDFGKGFVHVFDERSLNIVLGELDTISDFVQYLIDKEAFAMRPTKILASGEDLLAMYLSKNRCFPENCDYFVADDTCWDGFAQGAAYLAKNDANRLSYVWDNLIELLIKDFKEGFLQPGVSLGDIEGVVRVMARESRFQRRLLGNAYKEFRADARLGRSRARIARSDSGVTYMFLRCTSDEEKKYRLSELEMRTFIARGSQGAGETVVGITVVESIAENAFLLEVMLLRKVNWSAEDAELAAEAQRRTGYFSNAVLKTIHADEYPKD